jgi:hypothetical protein
MFHLRGLVMCFLLAAITGASSLLSVPAYAQADTTGGIAHLDVENAPEVPLYPDATNVSVFRAPPDDVTTIDFETPDDYQTVFSYYKQELPRYGWQLVRESSGYPRLGFIWLHGETGVNWNADLGLSFENLASGNTAIHIETIRWPDIDRIPLYTGARNVEVHTDAPTRTTSAQLVITYEVNASPDDVAAQYLTVLPEQGWYLYTGSSPITSESGLSFTNTRLVYSGMYPPITGLVVKARIGSNGLTHVTLQVRGEGVDQLGQQQPLASQNDEPTSQACLKRVKSLPHPSSFIR